MSLSQRLSEGQDVIEELRGELVEGARETETARSEAFDLLDDRERSPEQIAELQEKNRALTARHRDRPPEQGQLFRRARQGETPVVREIVTYERPRSRQLAEDARASADEAMRMSANQEAANRAARFQMSRNRAVNVDPLRDPWKAPPPPQPTD